MPLVSPIPSVEVLGVPVSIIDLPAAVTTIRAWCLAGDARYVCIRDVHGVMRAQDDPALKDIHERAGMVTPDGMPLVWITRLRGHRGGGRVAGTDLVEALCEASPASGLRHFFYGGKPGVAARMARVLSARYPGLEVAGCASPPFGNVLAADDVQITDSIKAHRPHVVWVGLSTPKQEYWMRDHVGRIPGATLIGVGAAFDFVAGDVQRAPVWMQRIGLEWLHRLVSEPRRLWRRYLVLAPVFAYRVLTEKRRRASP